MKIMLFLHGTAIMHRSAGGRLREVRVRQVQENEPSVRDFASYIPVGGVAEKLQSWEAQGAQILYLSSHRDPVNVERDKAVLTAYHFPDGPIYSRENGRTYQDVVEQILPDILIEDDCESIGGEPEMTYPHLSPDAKRRVKSIVVKEFGGIDHLPDGLDLLHAYRIAPI